MISWSTKSENCSYNSNINNWIKIKELEKGYHIFGIIAYIFADNEDFLCHLSHGKIWLAGWLGQRIEI